MRIGISIVVAIWLIDFLPGPGLFRSRRKVRNPPLPFESGGQTSVQTPGKLHPFSPTLSILDQYDARYRQ